LKSLTSECLEKEPSEVTNYPLMIHGQYMSVKFNKYFKNMKLQKNKW